MVFDRRIRNFTERAGLNAKKAAKQVTYTDRERADFIRKHFNLNINETARFDLLINVECFSIEQVAEIIWSALKLLGITA
ncbi:MAG: cytidylate kinase family protein [Planctomycetota bacterium]|nr:MAG: cytidylate kinase family protein [Planctomycetota bacterium]